jgi:hypothetical protein
MSDNKTFGVIFYPLGTLVTKAVASKGADAQYPMMEWFARCDLGPDLRAGGTIKNSRGTVVLHPDESGGKPGELTSAKREAEGEDPHFTLTLWLSPADYAEVWARAREGNVPQIHVDAEYGAAIQHVPRPPPETAWHLLWDDIAHPTVAAARWIIYFQVGTHPDDEHRSAEEPPPPAWKRHADDLGRDVKGIGTWVKILAVAMIVLSVLARFR